MIKILIPLHVFPTEEHITTILLNNLKKSLDKKIQSKYIFFIYTQQNSELELNDDILIYFNQFSNAVDVLKKIKPDIIFLNEDRSSIDLSFHIAGEYLQIPVLCPINHIWLSDNKGSKKIIFSKLKFLTSRFFSQNNDISKNKNQSYGKKLNFLISTMKNSNYNLFNIIPIFLKLFISQLTTKPIIFSKSKNNLFRLETESSVPILLKNKFPASNLIVTGNPIYDEVFRRINNFKQNKNNKLRILFAPSQVFEDGIWNKKDSDASFVEILNILINNNDKFSTVVKIHPTSVDISYYEKLLKNIEPNMQIFQKENFLDLLDICDLVIGYPANSTMLRTSLLAKKPIVLCNFFNNGTCEFLQKKLAIECKSPQKLVETIFYAIKTNPSTSKNASDFIAEYYYKFDGLSSERLASALISFLDKNKNT